VLLHRSHWLALVGHSCSGLEDSAASREMGDFGGLGEGDMRDIGDMGDMGDMGDTGDTGVAGLNLGSALSDTLTVIWGDSEEREESTDEISTTPVCPIYASAQPLTPAPAPPATRIFRSVLSAELTTRRLGGRFTRQQLQLPSVQLPGHPHLQAVTSLRTSLGTRISPTPWHLTALLPPERTIFNERENVFKNFPQE